VVYEDETRALKLISEELSKYHQVFVRAAIENNGLGLVLRVNGVDVGSVIGYSTGDHRVTVGVIYYVYVRRGYWNRGYGKVLVTSMEELLEGRGSKIYVASTSSNNIRSQKLFQSLGYEVLEWSELVNKLGHDVVEVLEAIGCMYDDDMIMIKPYNKTLLSKLKNVEYRSLWYKTCYKPWLEYRRHANMKF